MGQLFPCLFFFFFLINIVFGDESSDKSIVQGKYRSRIAGGHIANIEDHAYRVHLFPIHCGGTIIGKKWILSAWRCYHASLTVLVGHENIEGVTTGNMKVRNTLHQKSGLWREDEEDHIMLIELYEDLKLDNKNVKIAPLYSSDYIKDGLLGMVAGFGATDEHNDKSHHLRAVEVPIATHNTCLKTYPEYKNVLSTNPAADFCAGYDFGRADNIGGHHSHCKGDYGSGLIVDGQIIGVAIYSAKCGHAKTPAVFASVPFVRNWIERTISVFEAKSEQTVQDQYHTDKFGYDEDEDQDEDENGNELNFLLSIAVT